MIADPEAMRQTQRYMGNLAAWLTPR